MRFSFVGEKGYSTRPKRGPIEASIAISHREIIDRIPRVLSVAPLKLAGQPVAVGSDGVYSTRPKRGPIEAARSRWISSTAHLAYSTRPKRGPIEAVGLRGMTTRRITYSTRPKRGPIEA